MEDLPTRIERMETEQEELQAKIASPEFYKEPPDAIAGTLARIDVLKDSLHDAYARWDESGFADETLNTCLRRNRRLAAPWRRRRARSTFAPPASGGRRFPRAPRFPAGGAG